MELPPTPGTHTPERSTCKQMLQVHHLGRTADPGHVSLLFSAGFVLL